MSQVHDDVTRGRALVEAGQHRPQGMVDCLAVIAYYKQQREQVSQRGACAGHCRCELIEHSRGYLVCPHTYEPCKKKRLVEIVKLWERVGACSGS